MEHPDKVPDFEALQAQWRQSLEQQSGAADYANPAFLTTLTHQKMQQQTSETLRRLQRNLLADVLAALALVAAGYFFQGYFGRHLPGLFWLGLAIFSVGYHVYLYVKFKKQEPAADANLLEGLQAHIAALQKLLDMYRRTGRVFAVVLFGALVYRALRTEGVLESGWVSLDRMQYIWLFVQAGIALLAAVGLEFCMKWYADQLYGRHCRALAECRQALQEA